MTLAQATASLDCGVVTSPAGLQAVMLAEATASLDCGVATSPAGLQAVTLAQATASLDLLSTAFPCECEFIGHAIIARKEGGEPGNEATHTVSETNCKYRYMMTVSRYHERSVTPISVLKAGHVEHLPQYNFIICGFQSLSLSLLTE